MANSHFRLARTLVCTTLILPVAISTAATLANDVEGPGQPIVAQRWVPKALATVDKLRTTASSIPNPTSETEMPIVFLEHSTEYRRAYQLLWNLWLQTGHPVSLGRGKESFRSWLERNATSYEKYVKSHAELTLEQLHRLGINNSKDVFGTSLWYRAMKYLGAKTAFDKGYILDIHTIPGFAIVQMPLDDEAYAHLSIACSRWLEANREQMVWDSRRKAFRPKHGEYVGTKELIDSIVTEGFRHNRLRGQRLKRGTSLGKGSNKK